MAAPVPTINTFTLRGRTCVTWRALFTAGAPDNFADSVVVDLSTLTGFTTALRVLSIVICGSPGVAADVELDAATDVLIASLALGSTFMEIDFRDHPQGGPTAPSSATGDLLVTTRSSADGDELFIYVVCDSVA